MPDGFGAPRVVSPDAFILTRSGKKAGPAYPAPPIEDIAISLARLCRFSGHCLRFWSVLQHSMIVEDLVSQGDKRAALLHDSCESALNDAPSPFKTPETQHMEHRMLMRIFSEYLTPEEQYTWVDGGYKRVKAADEEAFLAEVHVVGTPALREKYPDRSPHAEGLVRKYLKQYPITDLVNSEGTAVLDFCRRYHQ